ncbi:aminopeptidase [Aristaeella lactis]|uniref:Leucyl aminopeptidase n=1 Tax=Aristaeella lactis TaxID=3046383 RepID=A0AC61PJ52_9FIRM|nr:aminopeptidase [Aristaeella lactis]QUA53990.1 aminopeptidase [Aristaeella lactis]SMC42017.1 leucyl aminopeptidase [Aristaeella lactis]
MERPNAWKNYTKTDLKKLEDIAKEYRAFIDAGKTERECAVEAVAMLEKAGYINLESLIGGGKKLKAGDKVYLNKMGKAILTFHMGKKPMAEGMNIVGAHIDSPRLDIKQNPLYEDSDFALADTHYYGGIKKYQWTARELALHGVVVKKDGTKVQISIGEKDDDPVVGISDLLIHLSQEQMGKKLGEAITGENLDIILGGRPLKGEEKEPVKAQVLQILKETYGIEEEDFISAEIEAVPAGKARDFGLDRSMIMGYGHDDRVCAFAELKAVLSLTATPEYTCCGMLVDKEEIGSVGATGMQSNYLENAVAEILELQGNYSELNVRRTLRNSRMLSCDVSAGFDPLYASAYEKKNAAWLGRGVCFNKFTGSRGKSGSNDANAEFMAKLRRIMDDNKVFWQTAELGKVDQGGGGTIAYICALYGMEVIDSGVAVLNMHAPMEVISKADLYEAVKAYKAFMLDA